jgi:uncharacterized membrane protein YtjA (UPF0391 family)
MARELRSGHQAQVFLAVQRLQLEVDTMLRLALLFLIIALLAGLFGFNLLAGLSWEFAKILFFVFLVLAVLALIGGMTRGAPPV